MRTSREYPFDDTRKRIRRGGRAQVNRVTSAEQQDPCGSLPQWVVPSGRRRRDTEPRHLMLLGRFTCEHETSTPPRSRRPATNPAPSSATVRPARWPRRRRTHGTARTSWRRSDFPPTRGSRFRLSAGPRPDRDGATGADRPVQSRSASPRKDAQTSPSPRISTVLGFRRRQSSSSRSEALPRMATAHLA